MNQACRSPGHHQLLVLLVASPPHSYFQDSDNSDYASTSALIQSPCGTNVLLDLSALLSPAGPAYSIWVFRTPQGKIHTTSQWHCKEPENRAPRKIQASRKTKCTLEQTVPYMACRRPKLNALWQMQIAGVRHLGLEPTFAIIHLLVFVRSRVRRFPFLIGLIGRTISLSRFTLTPTKIMNRESLNLSVDRSQNRGGN
jgi:hypothetical protein